MPGFGPLGPRSSPVRPSASPDSYGVQTWFKDCSAPGASDGTVPNASWFNHLIGNFIFAASQAGVEIANLQSAEGDGFLWEIIDKAIAKKIGGDIDPPWGL